MKVLVINGFYDSYAGKKAFDEFLQNVQKITKEESEKYGTYVEIVVRKRNQLAEYLYDIPTSYHQIQCAKTFDNIDLVYISGEPNLLPWMPEAEQMLIIIKMCLKVNKPLFASGFGMHTAVFLAASNLDRPIRIVNGKGKGTKTSELQNLQVNVDDLKACDYFLDHVTGDLYQYSPENMMLIPVGNAGLHLHSAANDFNSLGKFIVKGRVYNTNIAHRKETDVVMEGTEVICYIKKHLLSHWLFQDCEITFVVPTKAKWEIHPFNFISKDKVFHVLAESDKGPFITEMTNTICVKFNIDHKYPYTVKILRNFTQKLLQEFSNTDMKSMKSILTVNSDYTEKTSTSKGFIGNSELNNNRFLRKHQFQYFGKSKSSQKNMNVHDNQDNSTKNLLDKQGKNSFLGHNFSTSTGHNITFVEKNNIALNMIKISPKSLKQKGNQKDTLSNSSHKSPLGGDGIDTTSTCRSDIFKDNMDNTPALSSSNKGYETPLNKITKRLDSRALTQSSHFSIRKEMNNGIGSYEGSLDDNRVETSPSLLKNNIQGLIKMEPCKVNIRKMLYPGLENELTETKEVWVPGNYSKNRRLKYSDMFSPKSNTALLTENNNNKTIRQISYENKSKLKEILELDPGLYAATTIRVPYKIQVNNNFPVLNLNYNKMTEAKSYAMLQTLTPPDDYNYYSGSKLLFSPVFTCKTKYNTSRNININKK